jgi:hypothetical protein
MRKFIDWLASATCSWEFVAIAKNGKVVAVRGWWPVHGYLETKSRFLRLILAEGATAAGGLVDYGDPYKEEREQVRSWIASGMSVEELNRRCGEILEKRRA